MVATALPLVCAPLPDRPEIDRDDIADGLAHGLLESLDVPVIGERSVLGAIARDVASVDHALFSFPVACGFVGLICAERVAKNLREAGDDILVVRLNRHVCLLARLAPEGGEIAGDLRYEPLGYVARADDGKLYMEEAVAPRRSLSRPRDIADLVTRLHLVFLDATDYEDRLLDDDELDRIARAELRYGMTLAELEAGVVAMLTLATRHPVRMRLRNRLRCFDCSIESLVEPKRVFGRNDTLLAVRLFVQHYAGDDPFAPAALFADGLVLYHGSVNQIVVAPTMREKPQIDVTLAPPSALERAAAIARVRDALARVAREDATTAAHIAALVALD